MSGHDEIRIGVFVCRCGINIAGVLETSEAPGGLADFAKSLPNVEYATDNISFCTTAGAAIIQDAIQENNLNRVVMAA